MTKKLNHSHPILGSTDARTVMVDFDKMPFENVKTCCKSAVKIHKLGGFIILKTSKGNYHGVFDKPVYWEENERVVASICLYTHNLSVWRWFLLQCIKGESTLRVGPKRDKLPPRMVYKYGRTDRQVYAFLKHRRFLKDVLRKIEREEEQGDD